ncbi:MAG: hypothetical protein ABI777_14255, partial [Betaproteobacteria bacterium]
MIDRYDEFRHRCEPMGRLEFVIDSRHHDEFVTWLVLRPHGTASPLYAEQGLAVTAGCRVVVEANSLRPVGVVQPDPPVVPNAAGFNPYFDV